MDKNKIVAIFNSYLRQNAVNINEVTELCSEYLEDINAPNKEENMKLLVNNPTLITNMFPDVIRHFSVKHTICSIIFNNKILMYYVSD